MFKTNIIKISKGTNRITFCIGKYAFKIPNFTYSQDLFLKGCYSNLRERKLYKEFKLFNYDLCPNYFCSWMGLMQIQLRCISPVTLEVVDDLMCRTKNGFIKDVKADNIGMYKSKIYFIDYAD